MVGLGLLLVALAAPAAEDPPLPLRTDPPPKQWKADAINEALPYRWEKGTVHVLAWEVIADDRPWRFTQVLVLKRFDRPTEKGGHRWVLARVYHTEGEKPPWSAPMRVPPPLLPGQRMPKLTDAQRFGHEFYDDLPSDKQLTAFLRDIMWTPTLGTHYTVLLPGPSRDITTMLTAGGVDRALWKRLFRRDVRADLFPELKKTGDTGN